MYYNGNSVAVPAPADSPAISVYNNISFDCKNVDLYYGSFQALKGINLRIEKNQITALIHRPFRTPTPGAGRRACTTAPPGCGHPPHADGHVG